MVDPSKTKTSPLSHSITSTKAQEKRLLSKQELPSADALGHFQVSSYFCTPRTTHVAAVSAARDGWHIARFIRDIAAGGAMHGESLNFFHSSFLPVVQSISFHVTILIFKLIFISPSQNRPTVSDSIHSPSSQKFRKKRFMEIKIIKMFMEPLTRFACLSIEKTHRFAKPEQLLYARVEGVGKKKVHILMTTKTFIHPEWCIPYYWIIHGRDS